MKSHNVGVSALIGGNGPDRYSDGVEVSGNVRWLYASGTPGIKLDDGTIPETVEEQADLAWKHILAILESAGMGVADIVKVNQYLIRAEDKAGYIKVRGRYLGDVSPAPAGMFSVVTELIYPNILVELEVIAAKA